MLERLLCIMDTFDELRTPIAASSIRIHTIILEFSHSASQTDFSQDRSERRLLVGAQVVRDGLAGALRGGDITDDGGLDGLGAPGAW